MELDRYHIALDTDCWVTGMTLDYTYRYRKRPRSNAWKPLLNALETAA